MSRKLSRRSNKDARLNFRSGGEVDSGEVDWAETDWANSLLLAKNLFFQQSLLYMPTIAKDIKSSQGFLMQISFDVVLQNKKLAPIAQRDYGC